MNYNYSTYFENICTFVLLVYFAPFSAVVKMFFFLLYDFIIKGNTL